MHDRRRPSDGRWLRGAQYAPEEVLREVGTLEWSRRLLRILAAAGRDADAYGGYGLGHTGQTWAALDGRKLTGSFAEENVPRLIGIANLHSRKDFSSKVIAVNGSNAMDVAQLISIATPLGKAIAVIVMEAKRLNVAILIIVEPVAKLQATRMSVGVVVIAVASATLNTVVAIPVYIRVADIGLRIAGTGHTAPFIGEQGIWIASFSAARTGRDIILQSKPNIFTIPVALASPSGRRKREPQEGVSSEAVRWFPQPSIECSRVLGYLNIRVKRDFPIVGCLKDTSFPLKEAQSNCGQSPCGKSLGARA